MAAAAAAAALHDELLLDIFSRLPDPIDVLGCAATCAPWFRVVLAATAAGNLNLPQPHRSSFIAGVFYPAEPPGLAPPSFSCFLPNSDGLLLFNGNGNGKPLASRRGLLLSRLTPTPLDQRKLHLAVSHPLLSGRGRARLLPPPPFDLDPALHRDLTGYALLLPVTGAGFGFFRVLITAVVFGSGDHHRLVHRAYSYSSATGQWSAPVDCPSVEHLVMSGPRAGAVDDARGKAHWLYRNASSFYVLSVTGDATRAALTKIPMIQVGSHFQLYQQTLFPCLTGRGELALLHSYRRRERVAVDLWVKKAADDHGGSSSWVRSEMPNYRAAAPLEPLKVLGFAESAGKLLVCGVETWTLWWLDVESGETEEEPVSHECYYPPDACGKSSGSCQGYDSCSECTYNSRVIYELHWPSFLRHISAWS